MSTIILQLIPFYTFMLLGYGAGKLGKVSQNGEKGLSFFVFTIAVPAFLIKTLTQAEEIALSDVGGFLIYYLPVLSLWAVVTASLVVGAKRPLPDAFICGMTAIFGNTVMVGIPLSIEFLNPQAAVNFLILLCVHGLILLTAAYTTMECLANTTGTALNLPKRLASAILHQPVIIAIAISLSLNLLDVQLHPILDKALALPAQTVVPCGLFLVGCNISRLGLRGRWLQAVWVLTVKHLLLPLTVCGLGLYFELSPAWIAAATLMAAIPTGIMPYIIASFYQRGVKLASTSFVLSYVISPLTIPLILSLVL